METTHIVNSVEARYELEGKAMEFSKDWTEEKFPGLQTFLGLNKTYPVYKTVKLKEAKEYKLWITEIQKAGKFLAMDKTTGFIYNEACFQIFCETLFINFITSSNITFHPEFNIPGNKDKNAPKKRGPAPGGIRPDLLIGEKGIKNRFTLGPKIIVEFKIDAFKKDDINQIRRYLYEFWHAKYTVDTKKGIIQRGTEIPLFGILMNTSEAIILVVKDGAITNTFNLQWNWYNMKNIIEENEEEIKKLEELFKKISLNPDERGSSIAEFYMLCNFIRIVLKTLS